MAEHVFGEKKDAGVVVIDGHRYLVGPTTRSSIRALEEAQSVDEGDLSKVDEQATATIRYIDMRLRAENGGPPAGGVLQAAWDADEAGLEDLTALSNFIIGAEEDADPPPVTEASTTSGTATS